MKLIRNLALILLFELPLRPYIAAANPVSFKDGWGVMPAFAPEWSDLDLNYSFTARDAIGVSHFYREGERRKAGYAVTRYNRLFRRWNELDSQANIYGSIGAGGRYGDEVDAAAAGFAAVEADYETRRIYLLSGIDTIASRGGFQFTRVRGRAGFAPYTAAIDELNSWVVMQADYMTDMEDRWEITPLLRLFYNNYALEAGVSFDGDPFFAAMAHF